MNKILTILLITIIMFSTCYARPTYVASLENDGSVLAGLEYKSVGIKLPIIPTRFGFTKKSNYDYWGSYVAANAPYWFSLTKSFDKKDYKTGLDWKFRYYQIDENYNSTHTISGSGYLNAFGYYISKEFGNIEIHAGGYLCVDYGKNVDHKFYTDNEYDYGYKESRIDFTASIMFGIMLRI